MYLFDTDILSNLLRRMPSTTLIAKLASVPPEQQFTSSITLGELVYGAYKLGTRGAALLERLEKTLLPNLPILPFDATAARRYGEVRADLEQRGLPIGDADLRIATIALVRDFTVVTGNLRHFQRVPGLRVENWLEEE
jgi:predicted nucleic acid-binding protein